LGRLVVSSLRDPWALLGPSVASRMLRDPWALLGPSVASRMLDRLGALRNKRQFLQIIYVPYRFVQRCGLPSFSTDANRDLGFSILILLCFTHAGK
jgi:hypothetical protein